MQKILLATAVAASISFASFATYASDDMSGMTHGGAFAHIGAGQARHLAGPSTFGAQRAFGYDLTGGYRWGVSEHVAVGVEGGYAHLGSFDHLNFAAPGGRQVKNSVGSSAWLAGANLMWTVVDRFSLTGRAGLADVRSRFSTEVIGSRRSATLGTVSTRSAYFGLGVAYGLTDQLDLTLQATRFAKVPVKAARGKGSEASASTVNAGVEYRF